MGADALVLYVGAPVALALVAVLAAWARARARRRDRPDEQIGSDHD